MNHSAWQWKRLICWFCLSAQLLVGVESRSYDKCSTPDGRVGVCVVKRYCRETSLPLLQCEDDDSYCCPIPTTERSAPAPPLTEKPRPVFPPTEDRPRKDHSSGDGDRTRKTEVPLDNSRPIYNNRPLSQGPRRPQSIDSPSRATEDDARRYSERFGTGPATDGARNYNEEKIRQSSPTNEKSSGPQETGRRRETNDPRVYREDPAKSGQVDRARDTYLKDTRTLSETLGGELPRPLNKDIRAPTDTFGGDSSRPRESDRPRKIYDDDRLKSSSAGRPDNRRPTPHLEEDSPRKVYFSEADRELRKPPGSRREDDRAISESRGVDDYERNPPRKDPDRAYIDAQREDTYEKSRTQSQGYPRETSQTRNRYKPEDNHQNSAPESSRHPTRDERRPNRDESHPKRSEVPLRNPNDDDRTNEASKSPIRFPEPYEFSMPKPKVPACGVKPYDLFIAGGELSDQHEWPWMTAIFRRHQESRPKVFLCGGSLINTRYVLTAAHCFVNNYVILPASSFVVRLGSHSLDSGEEYTVSNLVVHHNHSGSDFFNDIALVRLASEVYITDKIAPICLPFPDMIHDDLVGRMGTVAGWGDVEFRTSGSRILQHVTIPIVSGDECFAAYSRVRGAAFLARGSDHVICAGLREGGKDACLGDSGGPLMLKSAEDRWVVVGIVSLGYKCAEPGYPGVYTRVTHYMSWIHSSMKRH